jgi:hypothetical protein
MLNKLIEVHQDGTGQLSWMRFGCSLALVTGCLAIIIQLLCAVVVSIIVKDLGQLSNIEWMQPITLIGVALTGKAVQKKTETNGNT